MNERDERAVTSAFVSGTISAQTTVFTVCVFGSEARVSHIKKLKLLSETQLWLHASVTANRNSFRYV